MMVGGVTCAVMRTAGEGVSDGDECRIQRYVLRFVGCAGNAQVLECWLVGWQWGGGRAEGGERVPATFL